MTISDVMIDEVEAAETAKKIPTSAGQTETTDVMTEVTETGITETTEIIGTTETIETIEITATTGTTATGIPHATGIEATGTTGITETTEITRTIETDKTTGVMTDVTTDGMTEETIGVMIDVTTDVMTDETTDVMIGVIENPHDVAPTIRNLMVTTTKNAPDLPTMTDKTSNVEKLMTTTRTSRMPTIVKTRMNISTNPKKLRKQKAAMLTNPPTKNRLALEAVMRILTVTHKPCHLMHKRFGGLLDFFFYSPSEKRDIEHNQLHKCHLFS